MPRSGFRIPLYIGKHPADGDAFTKKTFADRERVGDPAFFAEPIPLKNVQTCWKAIENGVSMELVSHSVKRFLGG